MGALYNARPALPTQLMSSEPALHCQERLKAMPRAVLQGLRRGIEKESLRMRPDGALATTPHPVALGSALKHPHVTTDFSESQLELITGVHTDAESCLKELMAIHQVVYRAIGDEQQADEQDNYDNEQHTHGHLPLCRSTNCLSASKAFTPSIFQTSRMRVSRAGAGRRLLRFRSGVRVRRVERESGAVRLNGPGGPN